MGSDIVSLDHGLIVHLPFNKDLLNYSGVQLSLGSENLQLEEVVSSKSPTSHAVRFNGINSYLTIQGHPALQLDDFAISCWIETEWSTDVVGDIVSQFDPKTRHGFGLSLITNTGVTSTAQANYRNVHFGIDQGDRAVNWVNHGRPGNAVLVKALHVSNGYLYASTFEAGPEETGHLWLYEGPHKWRDLGSSPDRSNSISSIVSFSGSLYCCTGRYNSHGSALGPAKNTNPGGRVYRVESDGEWTYCGHPGIDDAVPEDQLIEGYETGKADMCGSLTVFKGQLFVTCYYRRGVFKYEGGECWKPVGLDKRLFSFTIYQGELYALANGGEVFRYIADHEWEYCGTPIGSTQTYGAAIYQGDLYVGTWPVGDIQRYVGGKSWEPISQAGDEQEIMAMAIYNQKLYAGSLPSADVWRLDAGRLTFIANLDSTPDVTYRRVWSMAVYGGKLFAGTLPMGQVMSLEVGVNATVDYALPCGWQHLVAMRVGKRLQVYVNGQCMADVLTGNDFNLHGLELPISIGSGAHAYYNGRMYDFRIYNRDLLQDEIMSLAGAR